MLIASFKKASGTFKNYSMNQWYLILLIRDRNKDMKEMLGMIFFAVAVAYHFV